MNFITALALALFLTTAVSFYWLRKKLPPWGIVGVALLMIGSLFIGISTYEKGQEKVEKVWYPQAIQWTKYQIPLTVYWDAEKFRDYNDAFDKALETWNSRSDCYVITRVPQMEASVVRIRSFDGTACGHEFAEGKDTPAHATYCTNYVDIQIKRLGSVGEAHRIALHELGHAIGLDHDVDTVGAMSPNVMEPQIGAFPEYLLPSKKDVDEIKKRFCP